MLSHHHIFQTYLSLITTIPPILGKVIPSNDIRSIEMENIGRYLDGLFHEGEWYADWPASYKVLEQHHIWEIPQGKVMFHELPCAYMLISRMQIRHYVMDFSFVWSLAMFQGAKDVDGNVSCV